MKTKKQILLAISLLLASTLFVSFGYATWTENFIPIEQSYDAFSCSSVAKVYLDEDNDADTIPDEFFYLNSNFTLNGSTEEYSAGQILREDPSGIIKSKVRYYKSAANMIYKVTDAGVVGPLDNYTFRRASWVFPYNTPIRGIATTTNKVVFERPSNNNANNNIVGIYYDYIYKFATDRNGSSISDYRYNQVPNMAYLGNTYVTYHSVLPGSDGNRKRAWSTERTYSVCRDYQLHRCGDGTLDTYDSSWTNQFTGEICDEGNLNGTPGHCPINCGNAATNEYCGDNVIQPEGTYYNGGPETPENMSFEVCDDGFGTGDNGDGLVNGEDPEQNFCTLACLPPFVEAFVEVFINE